jgi:hypothetical protein
VLDENSDIQDATVIGFFSRMNDEEVEYAVLRNYELYPKFSHDIDLVVRWRDLPRLMAVARSCAIDYGWSALTECDHWARSSIHEHTIQVKRFYTVNPPQYFQIDAFHSHLVLGLPLFDEDALLRERIKDSRGFFRIDERVETFCRLFVIARLVGLKGTEEKVKRYSDRALSFWKKAPGPSQFAGNLGFPNISAALDFLRSGNLQLFKKEIDRQKRAWWIKQVSSHPLRAGKLVFNRSIDYLRLFWLRPCGFDLRVFANDEGQRKRLEQFLKRLTEANIITHFTLSSDFKERRTVRERGGIVVVWAPAESADVIIDCQADEQSIMGALITRIIERHPKLAIKG